MSTLFDFGDTLIKPSDEFIKKYEKCQKYTEYDTVCDLDNLSSIFNTLNKNVVDCKEDNMDILHFVSYSIFEELTAYIGLKNSYLKLFAGSSTERKFCIEKYDSYIKKLESLKHYIENVYNPVFNNYIERIFAQDADSIKKRIAHIVEQAWMDETTDFGKVLKEFLNKQDNLKESYFKYKWGDAWRGALLKNAW